MDEAQENWRCICAKCCPLGFGYKRDEDHADKLANVRAYSYGLVTCPGGSDAYRCRLLVIRRGAEKEDKGLQAWVGWRKWKRSPQPKWKVKARKKIKAPPGRAKFRRPTIRHTDYKGVSIVVPVVSRFTPDPERKTPALPINLRFLSSIGVTEWNEGGAQNLCRKPLERTKLWREPTVSTFASLCCSTKPR